MEHSEIASKIDHTLLKQTATESEIFSLCDEAIRYGAASVCIPPCFVKNVSDYVDGRIPVCTVIGFPNGYNSTSVKCFEAQEAIENGASEIDMVINMGDVKAGNYEKLLLEIRELRNVCSGKILKVIIETCLLTDDEKIRVTELVSDSGADFIKTSTGFSNGGATESDIILIAAHKKPHLKIKASGGIKTVEFAERCIELGADRIGASSLLKLL